MPTRNVFGHAAPDTNISIAAYDAVGTGKNAQKGKNVSLANSRKILAANKLFTYSDIPWESKFNRFGIIDPYNTPSDNREYLFFTKPDLCLFKSNSFGSELIEPLKNNTFFKEMYENYPHILRSLSYSVKHNSLYGCNYPFMPILSNACTSKLELPGITSESQESISNYYGSSITYRGHSLKSDNGYDFTLSFTDTKYMEIYYLAKAYDEYMRLFKLGYIELDAMEEGSAGYEKLLNQICNKVLPEQFSIYKFIVGEDGSLIRFYSKLTGVYITDVPRADFSDAPQDGFKYSLSFKAQFVEDNDPAILNDFNILAYQALTASKAKTESKIYDEDLGIINNEWCSVPFIDMHKTYDTEYGKRVKRDQADHRYFLKWLK